MPYLLFLKKRKKINCRLLQIIGGALRVKIIRKSEHDILLPIKLSISEGLSPSLHCLYAQSMDLDEVSNKI